MSLNNNVNNVNNVNNINNVSIDLLRSLRIKSSSIDLLNQLSVDSLSSIQSLSPLSPPPSPSPLSTPFTQNFMSTLSSSPLITKCESIKSKQVKQVKQVYSVEDKDDALVNLLWECGMWTSSNHPINNDELSFIMKPKIAVIDPKNVNNLNKLSGIYYQSNESNQSNQLQQPNLLPTLSAGSSGNSSVGSYGSIFSANSSLSSLDRFDDSMSVASNYSYNSITSQSLSSISSTTTSSSSSSTEKSLKSFKDYVFFSNRLTSVLQRKLGKKASGLEYQALYQFEARKFQYSILKGNVRIIKDYRSNNNGSTDYLIFKFGRASSSSSLYAVCEKNDRQPERQPWCCQHIISLHEMIEFFGLESISLDAQKSFLNNIKIEDELVCKSFNPEMNYNSNVNKITRMLKHGFYDFQKAVQKRNNNQYNQFSQSNKRKSRKNKRNGCSKATKLKNEDKFMYLSAIGHNLGVNTNDLFNIVSNAIEDSFLFARKYPSSVMTQGYIDEERGTLSFELVLEAEIYDRFRNTFYKFAVPIVESKNKQNGSFYYEAKNILTPKMAIDNIRLNTKNAVLDNNTWSVYLGDWNVSYYQQIDQMWFNKVDMLRAAKYTQYNNNIQTNYYIEQTSLQHLSRPSSRNIWLEDNDCNNDDDELSRFELFGTLKRASIDDTDDSETSSNNNGYSTLSCRV